MADVDKYLGHMSFWSHLTEDEKIKLRQNSVIRKFEKGNLVFDSGSQCLGFIYVLSGNLRTYMMSDEGREVTLFRFEEGEYCVLSASCVIKEISFDSYMMAQSDAELLIINASTVDLVSNNNIYFRCFLYELATKRFSEAMKTMDKLLFVRLEGRLAGFLLSEYERTGIKELRMTHEQVAQYINSAREVVARTLKKFSQEGLVEVKRGIITILDEDGLEDLI